MAHSYVELSGLWKKDTKRGEVLSARLTPAVRQKIATALLDTEGLTVELVVFPTNHASTPKSPTHKLLFGIESAQEAPRHAEDQTEEG